MPNYKDEIVKLEEISKSISQKSKDDLDIDRMTKIQHVQQCIHAAYVSLQKIPFDLEE